MRKNIILAIAATTDKFTVQNRSKPCGIWLP